MFDLIQIPFFFIFYFGCQDKCVHRQSNLFYFLLLSPSLPLFCPVVGRKPTINIQVTCFFLTAHTQQVLLDDWSRTTERNKDECSLFVSSRRVSGTHFLWPAMLSVLYTSLYYYYRERYKKYKSDFTLIYIHFPLRISFSFPLSISSTYSASILVKEKR